MPGMPDLIQKSPVMMRFEHFTEKPVHASSSKIRDAISRLNGDPSLPENQLVQIAIDLDFYTNEAAAEHFQRHWLGEGATPKPFWPGMEDTIREVLRQGMEKVCERFQSTAKPCEFWWVMSGDEGSDVWQMSVSEGKRQITAMFHTPFVPCDVDLEPSNTIWLTLQQDDDNGNAVVVTRRAEVPKGTQLPPDTAGAAKKGKKGKKSKKTANAKKKAPKWQPARRPAKKAKRATRGPRKR